MRRFAGVAAFAVVPVMMTSVVAGAAPPPTDESVSVQRAAVQPGPGAKCVTRKEYRRLGTKGKRASSPAQARRIIGYNGTRESLSHDVGHRWEIRKYLRCNSEILHVYVNYRDNRSYRKAW